MKKTAYFLICFCVVILDQLSKNLILKKVPNSGIFLFRENLKLEVLYNNNLAFGIHLSKFLMITFILIAICLIFYLLIDSHRNKQYFSGFVISLVLAGATSNLIDRVIHNGVIDYFSITVYNFTWPSFNFADAIIVIGTIWYIILQFKKTNEKNI